MTVALEFHPALSRTDLLAAPVAAALQAWAGASETEVAAIDPALADTAAFCEHYGISPAESANCVVIAARRGGETTYAACMVAATTRADVNGLVRRHLGARKASFAPVDEVTAAADMEYGGITPVGLPDGLAGPRRRGRGEDGHGDHRLRHPRLQAAAARPPARRAARGPGPARARRSGGAELTLSYPDGHSWDG